MQSGFYMSGVAGQLTQHKLNDINHNLANVNTIGYMASRSSFSSTMAGQVAGQTGVDPASYPGQANSFIDMKAFKCQSPDIWKPILPVMNSCSPPMPMAVDVAADGDSMVLSFHIRS